MAYTNAIFHMDYLLGSDAARATLVDVVFSNPSGTTVLGTKVAHGLVTGAVITVSGCTQAYANTAWKVTWVDADTFTLDTALWASFNGADVTGDAVPFGGQSFTDAWKTITAGATAARIAPGDTIRLAKSPNPTSLGQNAQWNSPSTAWKGSNLPAAVAITSSTNATPIVVTKAAHGMINGDVVKIIGHTTNTAANGVWVVANKTDNTYELEGSVGNGIGGASGTFQRVTDRCVVLTTAVTTTIEKCEANWTAGTNVTSANVDATVWREYLRSIKVITAAGHAGAGIIAKFGLPASLNLSGRRQVSFAFRNETSALAAAGDMKLKLYSDAACTSEVETFDLPAIPSTARWINITIDKGSALSATVQGVALYANAAMASKTFYIDGIIACNDSTAADSLTLTSLISKNTLAKGANTDTAADYASEGWYSIMSIDGRIIVLASQDGSATPFTEYYHRPYMGVAESVNLYKRETIKTTMVTGATTVVQEGQDSGTVGNVITLAGGYNTSSGALDGETIFDGQNGYGYGLYWTSRNYWNISGCSGTKYNNAIRIGAGTGVSLIVPDAVNCSNTGVFIQSNISMTVTIRNSNMNTTAGVDLTNTNPATVDHIGSCCGNSTGIGLGGAAGTIALIGKASGNNTTGISFGFTTPNLMTVETISDASHNTQYGVLLSMGEVVIKNLTECSYNSSAGVYLSSSVNNRIFSAPSLAGNTVAVDHNGAAAGNNYIMSGRTSGSTTVAINVAASAIGDLFLFNFEIDESAKVTIAGNSNDPRVYIGNYNKDTTLHRTYTPTGSMISQATVRNTASGVAWQIDTTSATIAGRPLRFPIAKIACEANKEVTVSLYMRRASTNCVLSLFCRAGQLPGATLASDLKATVDAAIDTWQQRTITFTPTQAGVVQIEVEQSSLTVAAMVGYFDDLAVSQAA